MVGELVFSSRLTAMCRLFFFSTLGTGTVINALGRTTFSTSLFEFP